MPTRIWFRLAELIGAISLAAILFTSWRADRRDRAQLAADLAAAKQTLAQADVRQHARDAQLAQTLSAIAAEKRTTASASPAQILRALPKQIPLPSPITLQSDSTSCGVAGSVDCGGLAAAFTAEPNHPSSPQATKRPIAGNSTLPGQAILPSIDLKPLYDYTLDCQAYQAKLSAAQADLADERTKTTVLTRERDEAVRAAKGGSLLRRIARNAKWLVIGVIAGAIAAKAHP